MKKKKPVYKATIYRDIEGNKERRDGKEWIPISETEPDEESEHGYTRLGKKKDTDKLRASPKKTTKQERGEMIKRYVDGKMHGNPKIANEIADDFGVSRTTLVRRLKQDAAQFDQYVGEQYVRGITIIGKSMQIVEEYLDRELEKPEPDEKTATWILHAVAKYMMQLKDLIPAPKSEIAQLVGVMEERGISIDDLREMAATGLIPEGVDQTSYRKLLKAIGADFKEPEPQDDPNDNNIIDIQAEVDQIAKEAQ